MTARKAIDIEKLLHWTYRQELAKLDFVGFSWMTSFAELGTKVQDGMSSGGLPQAYAAIVGDGVDPDAERVHEAVLSLGAFHPDWEEPELLLADMPGEIRTQAPKLVQRYAVQLGVLVMRCSRMGTRPDWRAEIPEKLEVRQPRTGQPAWFVVESVPLYGTETIERRVGRNLVRERAIIGEERREVDGFDQTSRRPKPGAYKKYVYDPDPAAIADLRADYSCWHAGLTALAESLAGALRAYEPQPPSVPAMPWSGDQQAKPRVLASLFAQMRDWPKPARRSVPLPRERAPKAGPVRHVKAAHSKERA